MSHPPKRQRRSRVACDPCRDRKRKCNGRHPCETCLEFEYTCCYDLGSRKRRNKNPILDDPTSVRPAQSQHPQLRSDPPTPSMHASEQPLAKAPAHSIESNSGAVFMRDLGLKIDPLNAPEPEVFAWNIGPRLLPGSFPALPIVQIISQEDLKAMAHVYFDKVAPYYGFIDKTSCFEHINSRWLQPSAFEPYDVVLCGIAVMGIVFTHRKPVAAEMHLVESVRSALEQCSMHGIPFLTTISGWALRIVYLRQTASAHTVWMASCTLLHLIEASGLHLAPTSKSVLNRPPQNIDENIRRRLVSFAQYVNVWTSFDLGRSRVTLHGASYATPISSEGDYTPEMLDLLPLSESLDPHKPVDSSELTTMLVNVMESIRTQPPVVLSKTNLVLCIFRRLRAVHSDLPADLLSRMITLVPKALACARTLVDENCPWSHVANVPFQIVCSLLAVDSPESLSLLGDAMQTLKHVVDVYGTDTIREAYRTAGLLILLQQRRKDRDAKHLSNLIDVHFASSIEPAEDNSSERQRSTQNSECLRDFIADVPVSDSFDFSQFFIADNPWDILDLERGI